MKNKIYISLIAILLAGMSFSCDSDITKVFVNPDNEIILRGGTEDVVLSAETPDALALTLYWDHNNSLKTSDKNVEAPLNASELTLQLSDTEEFSNNVEVVLNKGENYKQFLCSELNSLLTRLGFSSESLSPLYIRIKSELASNMAASYSNQLIVNIQPYRLKMDKGFVLAADKSDTGIVLISPEENGIYTGFMGVAAWYNWWFLEANNLLWGNNGDTGVPFEASTEESHWNFWFPEDAGCYYVTLNTIEEWWSALHIDNLVIGGDITGEMTYNQKSNEWTLNVDKPAGEYQITLTGEGALYDRTTDTYRSGAISKEISFIKKETGLELAEGVASEIKISLPGGMTGIILNLSDPAHIILTTGEAEETDQTEEEILWMSGFDDGITGEWNFNCYLTAYDLNNGKYAAVHQANSLWGWLLYTDDNWGGVMGTDSDDPYNGNIIEGGGNIPSPNPGRYLVDVSLSDKEYSLYEINEVWYTGLNDDWELYPMRLVEGCIYEAEVEKYADTPWGIKIVLREDWSIWFGGGSGILRYGWNGFDGANSLEDGTYLLTVDLAKCTYNFTSK